MNKAVSHRPKAAGNKTLVLFDFDGTLAKGDSFGAFLWHAVPVWRLLFGAFRLLFQLPSIIFMQPDASAEQAKKIILQTFFKGKRRKTLEVLGSDFYEKKLRKQIRPSLLEILRAHTEAGDAVVVVSASIDVWLKPFCKAEHIELICTELAYEQDIFCGRLATPNCNRAEKARRIEAAYELPEFSHVIAYGNSAGDYAMFALAQEAWLCSRDGQLKKWP